MNKPFNIIIMNHLRPVGGPCGYLYNLQASLQENDIDSINILSLGMTPPKNPAKKRPIKSFIRQLKLKYTPSSFRFKYLINKQENSYASFFSSIQHDLKDSKLNHFHGGTTDFYYYMKTHPGSSSLNVITSHSPELPHVELLSALQDNQYSSATAEKLYSHQKMIDIYAFKNADYIIFPCEEAVSPYDKFIDEHSIDRSKFRYIITASKPITFKLSRSEFRTRHGIPENATTLAYIGRKNEIKGYNIFCQAAVNLQHAKNFIFLSAGGGAIKTPKIGNIIDFGWTDDPGSILNACDYLVAPNRDTYFDLGIIQALSLNKPVITTPTGGNRWFLDKNLDIIFTDYDADKLATTISKLRPVNSNSNKDFFDKYLDNKHFAKNYLTLYESLTNENSTR